jgi:hypothetical protein
MHANAIVLQGLFTSLDQHDHEAMAAYYHPQATFRDIAFDLRGKKQIHAMWHMICNGDIRTVVRHIEADDDSGRATVQDDYTFSSTGRKVRNVIDSHFRFRDGFIVEQQDHCNARRWATMALGGIKGLLAGSFRFLRAQTAREKLDAFIARHPQYR